MTPFVSADLTALPCPDCGVDVVGDPAKARCPGCAAEVRAVALFLDDHGHPARIRSAWTADPPKACARCGGERRPVLIDLRRGTLCTKCQTACIPTQTSTSTLMSMRVEERPERSVPVIPIIAILIVGTVVAAVLLLLPR